MFEPQFRPIILFFVWLIAVILVYQFSKKPLKKVVEKYGEPLHHFSTSRCWNKLPIKNSRTDIDIYADFLVITEGKKEIVLSREFKSFEILDPIFGFVLEPFYCKVIEFEIEGKKLQLAILTKQEQLLKEFFQTI